MNYLEQLVLHHILASQSVVLALASIIAHLDRIIALGQKLMGVDQEKALVDKIATAVKAEMDKVAAQPKP